MVSPLAKAVMVCRVAGALLCIPIFVSMFNPRDARFTAIRFLEFTAPLYMVMNLLRLVYDAALLWLPMVPPNATGIYICWVTDWVMLLLMGAASISSLNVVDVLVHTLGQCGKLDPGTCSWYTTGAVVSFFTTCIGLFVAYYAPVVIDHALEQ